MSALVDHQTETWLSGTTQAAEGLPRRRFTTAEIEAFVACGVIGEKERFELIGGEIVPMSPKGLDHERVKTSLMLHFVRTLPDGYLVTPETTFHLTEDTFIEPDFVFYSQADGLKGLDGGTCVLAVEVSASSLAYDRGRKADLYASFGIRELWVVDVAAAKILRHREPSPDGYGEVREFDASQTIEAAFIPQVAVRFSEHDVN